MPTQSKRSKTRMTASQTRAARRARRNRRRRLLRISAFVAVAVISFLFIAALFAGSLPISIGSRPETSGFEKKFAEQTYSPHLRLGQSHPDYNSVPATSGWHLASPARWGVHNNFIPDETIVHNLEHGGIGIHYNCPEMCPELIEQLESIVARVDEVILSPYPEMQTRIALTAWTYLDTFEEFDEDRIEAFVAAHMNSSVAPEHTAR